MVHLYPYDIVTIPFCFHDYYSAYFPPPPPRVYSNFLILVIVALLSSWIVSGPMATQTETIFPVSLCPELWMSEVQSYLQANRSAWIDARGKKKKKKESPGSKDIIIHTNSRVQNCFFFFLGCHNKGSQTR